jgi:ubiquitin-like 1-activating enzyme E1 A
MEGPSTSVLSEEEAAIYDRQIRLWGADAQRRVQGGRIAIGGLSGVTGEVIKNLVLAGVGALHLMDSRPVDEADLGSIFFLSESHIGQNKAEAAYEAIQALNPQVRVTVEAIDINHKPEEELLTFDIICLDDLPLQTLVRVNEVCRRGGKMFYASASFGYRSYFFCDLNNHQFIIEDEDESKKKLQKKSKTRIVRPPAKKRMRTSQESHENNENEADTKKMGKLTCPSLKEALSVGWAHPSLSRIPKLFFALQVYSEWRSGQEARGVRWPETDEHIQQMIVLKNSYLQTHRLNPQFLTDDFIREVSRMAGAEVSGVCAIIGGILAQQVIKVLSAKNEPEVSNFFFYDAKACSGIVEFIRPIATNPSASAPTNTAHIEVVLD